MAARRSGRLAGAQLNGRPSDIEADARHQALSHRRTDQEARHADVACQFNIFDLLPELRVRIYAYAMSPNELRSLTNLKVPTLALVSKQVRAEALPVFLAECTFAASVTSRYAGDAFVYPSSRHNSASSNFDNGPGRGKAAFRKLGKRDQLAVLFRNVELELAGPIVPSRGYKPERSLITIRVSTAPRPQPIVGFTAARVDGEEYSVAPEALARLRSIVALRIAQTAAAHEHFLGFTLEEVDDIAGALR